LPTAWQAALAPGNLLEDGGVRARYAPETNRKLVKNYSRWLTWLSRRGLLDEHTPPAERITPERVKAWVTDLQTINASGTILARLQALYEMAKVLEPARDWQWIRRIESRVRARHVPVRLKRSRLVGAADLLALGEQLMQSAPAHYNQAQTIDAARRYQDFLLTLRGGTMRKDLEPVENR
jgi:integrase/recombinase XerD